MGCSFHSSVGLPAKHCLPTMDCTHFDTAAGFASALFGSTNSSHVLSAGTERRG